MNLYPDCIPGCDWRFKTSIRAGSKRQGLSMGWQELQGRLKGFAEVLDALLRNRWRALVALCAGLAVAAALLIAFRSGHSGAAGVTPYPPELAPVSFGGAGNVIPHEPIRAEAKAAGDDEQGWAGLFSDVTDVFKGA